MEKEIMLDAPNASWKWAGSVREEGSKNLFHAIISMPKDLAEPAEVWLSDGSCSLARSPSNQPGQKESLALMPSSSTRQAVQKALTHHPKLARVEKDELRIAIPWGAEFEAGIDLDIECFKLAKEDGTASFLSALFALMEDRRLELRELQTKTKSIRLENDNLRRAKDRFAKYMSRRPTRLRVAAELLNRHKRKCRLSKREEQGPEENVCQQ